ncbi:MAG: ABC transporter permease [Candidatus Dormiibacterota bacterium]
MSDSLPTPAEVQSGRQADWRPRPADRRRWSSVAATAFHVAWRNLTGERRRWAVSTIALGIAAMLVIFLEGTARWVTSSGTAYLDHSGSHLVVAQTGVDDLLFAQSIFPMSTSTQVGQVNGVASAASIVGVNGVVSVGGAHLPVYLIGFQPGQAGGPWKMQSGSGEPHGSEVVLDRGFARVAKVEVGQTVRLFGQDLKVVGTSAETDAAGDFFVFVPLEVAQKVAGEGAVSYSLVKVRDQSSAGQIASSINQLPGVHALPRSEIAANDRAMMTTSFSQPVQIVALVGLVAGILITGIVLYTTTVEHSRDYAVLKAIGASGGVVYGSALLQAVVLSIGGILLGWGMATAMAFAFETWDPVVEAQLDADLVISVAAVILVVNVLASLLPIRHVSRIDPQEVFKA